MEGEGVIDVRSNTILHQELPQPVSFLNADNVLMEDVAVFILNRWELKTVHRREEILK